MPQVTMPDGTTVEMPENPSPELQARLQRFISDYNAKAVAGKPKAEPEPKPASMTSPKTDDGMRTMGAEAPELGAAEAGMNVISSMIAAPAGGLTGIGAAVGKMLGLTDAKPSDVVKKVQETLTYQPRSDLGQRLVKTLGTPFEKLAEVGDKAGEKAADATGSPLIGAAVNTGIQSLPLIAGKLAPRLSARLQAMEDAAADQRQKIASLQAPAQDGIQGARAAGYVITPSTGNGGIVSRSVEGLAGEPKLAKLASQKNAHVTNDLVRKDLGIADDQPITRDALENLRQDQGQHYEAIKQAGTINSDPQYVAALNDVRKSYDTAAKDFPHRSENPFQKTIDGLTQESFDSSSAVEEVKLLRQDADTSFRTGNKGLGLAYRKMAQAVDDLIDRNLTGKAVQDGQKAGVDAGGVSAEDVVNYRNARKLIAKSYVAEKALNDSTGNIDARVYAKALKSGVPLDGAALQVAKFGEQFPRLAQSTEKLGSTAPSYADLVLAGLGSGGSVSKAALLASGRPVARASLLSGPIQRMIAAQAPAGRPLSSSLPQLAADAQANPAMTIAEMSAMASQNGKQ